MALELVGAAMEAWRAPESCSGVTSGGFREESFFFLPALEATGGFSEEEAVLPGDLAGGAGGITVELAGLEVAGGDEVETGVEEAGGASVELLSWTDETTTGSDDPD